MRGAARTRWLVIDRAGSSRPFLESPLALFRRESGTRRQHAMKGRRERAFVDNRVRQQLIEQPQRAVHRHAVLLGLPAQTAIAGQQGQAGLPRQVLAGNVRQRAVVVLGREVHEVRHGLAAK